MANSAITVRGLKKRLPEISPSMDKFLGGTGDSFTLGPLDFTVPQGTVCGLIGPNGAGKTTALNLIMGLWRKDTGDIEVLGLDHIEDEVEMKRRTGFASPEISFTPWKKIGDLIRFLQPLYTDWDAAYCGSLLERMGLRRDEAIATLSFGSRIKLGVVMALAHRPDLLLLDEPFAGIDAVSKHEVFDEILATVQDERRTVVISSHNLQDLERFADYLVILSKGKLLLEGSTATLIERFRMADALLPDYVDLRYKRGVYAFERDAEGRCRFLLDTESATAQQIEPAAEIALNPVTLEDLFVILVKDPRHV